MEIEIPANPGVQARIEQIKSQFSAPLESQYRKNIPTIQNVGQNTLSFQEEIFSVETRTIVNPAEMRKIGNGTKTRRQEFLKSKFDNTARFNQSFNSKVSNPQINNKDTYYCHVM